MKNLTLRSSIKSFLQKNSLLTHVDIAKKLRKDKSKVSGYLEAMVDYGEISVKKVGNSKVYFLKDRLNKE